MPANVEQCVKDLVAQGKSEDSAWAICKSAVENKVDLTDPSKLSQFVSEFEETPKKYRIYKDIFSSYIATDGRFDKMAQKQRDNQLIEMFNNTQKWLSFEKARIPIAPHDKFTERLQGSLEEVKLIKKSDPSKHYTIMGGIDLFEDAYQDYKDGRFPGVSIVYSENSNIHQFTGKPKDILKGKRISEVALLGASNEAFPNLDTYTEQDYNAFYNYFSALKNIPDEQENDMAMDMNELKKKFMDFINEVFGDKEGENQPDKEKEDDKIPAPGFENKTPLDGQQVEEGFESDESGQAAAVGSDVSSQILEQLKAINTRLDAVEKSDQFDQDEKSAQTFKRLVKEKKLIAEQEKEFSTMVKKNGLELVDNFFTKAHPQVPAPSGIEHVDTTDEKAIKETPEYKKWFTKFSESGRHTEEAAHEAALQAIGQELIQKQAMTA